MMTTEFRGLEYCSDRTFAEVHYRFEGDEERGFRVERNGRPRLELGPGYRVLRSEACGVCSTDLDRHFLPFPLPQITGHELVATDEDGARYVVEINASHAARGVPSGCPFCASGLDTHCAERLVLGIHDLPGGFGPWVLAPVRAALRLPAAIPTSTAVLVEPFAAALHAVTTMNPAAGERVAVLGPRRLGLLVVAALAGIRKREKTDFRILGVSRHEKLLDLARHFGADDGLLVGGALDALPAGSIDRVIDTTGSPEGLELAIRLAHREVHLKSTHGQPAAGLTHLTELVVDEIGVGPFVPEAVPEGAKVAWLVDEPPPAGLKDRVRMSHDSGESGPRRLLAAQERTSRDGELPRFDLAVVGSAAMLDLAIRPSPDHERTLLRPRGTILLHPSSSLASSTLLGAVVERGLRLSSSRCGNFQAALDLLAGDPDLRRLGDKLVTHRFKASDLGRAFEVARSPACIKAVVEHVGVPS
jgi:threonine dehydrogenase-like Zn-dependent dehydrogenase